jgi:hypothetical protein
MGLIIIPTKTDASLGRVKNDRVGAPAPDLNFKVPAAEYERLKDAEIANAQAIGLGDGSTPNSLAGGLEGNNIGITTVRATTSVLVKTNGSTRATVTTANIDATVPIRGSGGGAGAAAIAPNSADPDTGLKATVANELRLVAGDIDTLIVKSAEVLGANNVSVKLQGSGEYLYNTVRSKIIRVTAADFFWSSGYALAGGGKIQASAINALAQCNINKYLRTGQIITLIRYLVAPGTAEVTVSNRTHLSCQTLTHDYATPAGAAASSQFDINDAGTTTLQVVATGALSIPVDLATKEIELTFEATNTVGTGTVLHSVEITVSDPGPRNW